MNETACKHTLEIKIVIPLNMKVLCNHVRHFSLYCRTFSA